MANIILDDKIINKPVANAAARLALPTANLETGMVVNQVDDSSIWVWNGSGWKNLSTALNEFNGFLGNSSNASPLYVGVSDAYGDGVYRLMLLANVEETADTTLGSTDQIYLKIRPNTKWDQKAFAIDGAEAGEQITIDLADASAVHAFESVPFKNLDVNSSLMIIGNGGTVINAATDNDTAIAGDGKIYIKDIGTFKLPNAVNGGINTNALTALHNINFEGGGVLCNNALVLNGGQVSNLKISKTFISNAVLIKCTAPTNLLNVFSDVTGSNIIEVSGNISHVSQGDTSNLTVSASSESNLSNIKADFITLLADVVDCNLIGCLLKDSIVFANDNSNNNINIVGATFVGQVQIYGTNINFHACNFKAGYVTFAGSNGSIVGCNSAVACVDGGTFRKEANDSTIGNDA